MKLSSFLVGLVAAPLVLAVDNASKVNARLQTTIQDVTKLNNTLNSFPNGGPIPGLTLISVKNQGQTITYDIGNVTQLAKASSNFSSAESKTIATTVNTLVPDAISLLNNFIRHEPAFASTSSGVKAQVLASLKQQKTLTQQQGTALAAKLTSPYKQQAPKITAKVIAAYNKAIKAYS